MLLSFIKKAFVNPELGRSPFYSVRYLLRCPVVFDVVSFFMQLKNIRKVKELNNETGSEQNYHEKVKQYNAGVTYGKLITTTRRSEVIYQISTLYLPRNVANDKLLIIGPRNIQELFIAWLYGYKWKNIHAIDLYSTSNKIQKMNMEELTFDDNSYDCVTMSATLAYASNTEKVIEGIARVLKPGGLFVFGATYDPNNKKHWIGSDVSGEDIHEILKKYYLDIFSCISRDKINSDGFHQTTHFIGSRKRSVDQKSLDPLYL